MRFALLTPPFAAVVLLACSTFSDTGEEEPPTPPPVEAGSDVAPVTDPCSPAVFDPNAPSLCPDKDLKSDPQNCGVCGHACVDTPCVAGLCERETLIAGREPVVAIDGTYVYKPVNSAIHRAKLSESPLAFTQYFDNLTGKVNHLEVHAGVLYIGWDNNQTTLELSEPPKPSVNQGWASLKTDVVTGHYLPGATSYYLFPDKTVGEHLARISPNAPLEVKDAPSFSPLARSGEAIYWMQKLGSGTSANIVGPWERASEALAIVDAKTEAFAAEGDTVFIAGGTQLSRTTRGAEVKPLATESGVGVAFAIEGDQLFYAVRRTQAGAEERYLLFRIDKCEGGAPVPLMDINQPIRSIHLTEPGHVIVNTESGLFRTRR